MFHIYTYIIFLWCVLTLDRRFDPGVSPINLLSLLKLLFLIINRCFDPSVSPINLLSLINCLFLINNRCIDPGVPPRNSAHQHLKFQRLKRSLTGTSRGSRYQNHYRTVQALRAWGCATKACTGVGAGPRSGCVWCGCSVSGVGVVACPGCYRCVRGIPGGLLVDGA